MIGQTRRASQIRRGGPSALCSSVFISGSVRSTGLSRRLLVGSAAGAIVELVSPPAPAVHLAPGTSD